jgi:Cytochrome bd terminal oxidase subunit I
MGERLIGEFMPFSLEGFALFTEAIFLWVYLYGWNGVLPVLHWVSAPIVALSGIFIVTVNAWMNAPQRRTDCHRLQFVLPQNAVDGCRRNVEVPSECPHGALSQKPLPALINSGLAISHRSRGE